MKYFRLSDDVTIPDRWHLGIVSNAAGAEPRLLAGTATENQETLFAPVTHGGHTLDFSLTSFAVPVASLLLAREMKAIAGTDLQCLPVRVPGTSGMMVLNATRSVQCLDESRSEFIKWTDQDHRSDLAGQYRQVTKLSIHQELIPHDAHFFRIKGWSIAIVVSEAVKLAMISAGCRGAVFTELC